VVVEGPARLDEVDGHIVEAFRGNGRLSNAQVARAVGVSEATVRRRVHRLVDRRILKFAALTDPRRLGLAVEALIGLNVEPGSLDEVGRELATMDQVRFLGLAMGALDILVVARFPSLDAWLSFRSTELGRIKGIQRIETFQIVKVLKRTYDWIFEEPGGMEDTETPARDTKRRRRASRRAVVARSRKPVATTR